MSPNRQRQAAARAPSQRQRQLRVGELIRHALSDVLQRGEIADPVLERIPVTVPEVRMTPDLRQARVFVMPLGGAGRAEIVEALDRHRRALRGILAKRVKLKYMPDLAFDIDASFDAANRIDELLRSPEVARDIEGDDGDGDR